MDHTTPNRRDKALVLVRHEVPGRPYVEVYGESNLDVRIVTVPHVGTNPGEIIAEELVEGSLPICYRELLWPGNLRAHSVVTLQRPSDVVERQHHLQLLRGLDAMERRLAATRRPKRHAG